MVSGGYGIARATRRYLRAYRPGQILNGAYQYGAIGPDVGYTVGAGAAVQQGVGPQAPYKGAPMLAITGDAGMGYSGMEIETLGKYKMPVVLVVYNNNAWGVWQSGTRAPRSLHMYLFQENLRYDKVAEGSGSARRVRDEGRGLPADVEAVVGDGGEGRRLDADQLPGAQRILDQRVPAGDAAEGGAGVYGVLPLIPAYTPCSARSRIDREIGSEKSEEHHNKRPGEQLSDPG